jgi:hypothetical protein
MPALLSVPIFFIIFRASDISLIVIGEAFN